jgi:hypothetical protein
MVPTPSIVPIIPILIDFLNNLLLSDTSVTLSEKNTAKYKKQKNIK